MSSRSPNKRADLGWILALAALVAPAGCVIQTRETVKQAGFGFERTRAAGLVIVEGDVGADGEPGFQPELVDALRFRLAETGLVELVGERRVRDLPDVPALCALATAMAAETGKPVEQVLTLTTSLKTEPHDRCVMFGGTPPPDDGSSFWDRLDDDYVGPGCNTKYTSTTATASAALGVVDVAGCRAGRTVTAVLAAESTSGDREGDAFHGRAAALRDFAAVRARPLAEDLYPRGLEAVAPSAGGPQDAARLDVIGDTATLRPGVSYVVRGPRDGKRTRVGQVRVTGTDGGVTRLTTEPAPLVPEPGDELVLETHTHEWKLLPIGTVGELVGDARSSLLAGYGAAARWSYPRAYLTGELLFSHQVVPDFDTTRNDLGLAVGGRMRVGPLAPYVVGEAGLAFLPKSREGNTSYWHTKGFVGVGVGVELWFGRYVIVVDARLREATGLAEGSMELSESYRQRTLQLGFGQRL